MLFVILTLSSPSVISISDKPDSSSNSISFYFSKIHFYFLSISKAALSASSYPLNPRPEITPSAMSEKYDSFLNSSLEKILLILISIKEILVPKIASLIECSYA